MDTRHPPTPDATPDATKETDNLYKWFLRLEDEPYPVDDEMGPLKE